MRDNDVADGTAGQRPDGLHDARGIGLKLRIHDNETVIPDLYCRIAAVADEHVDVSLNGKNLYFTAPGALGKRCNRDQDEQGPLLAAGFSSYSLGN